MKKISTGFVVLILVFGCSVSGPLPDYDTGGTAVDYAEGLIAKTTARNLDRFIDMVDDGESDGYRWLKGYWCPRHDDVGDVTAVKREFNAFCASQGGEYEPEGFCRDRLFADNILFVAKASASAQCNGGPTVTLHVIEPTAVPQSLAYVEQLRTFGYETVGERTERLKIAAEIEAARAAEWAAGAEDRRRLEEEERLARQARRDVFLASSMGTRICSYGTFNYVITTGTISAPGQAPGYLVAQLDGFSDDKTRLRFRVLGVDISSRRGRVAPFASDPQFGEFVATPGIVYWDRTESWSACE